MARRNASHPQSRDDGDPGYAWELELNDALGAYDGRHPEILERVSVLGAARYGWIDSLLDRARSGEHGLHAASGAIWLLRSAQKRGIAFSREQVASVCRLLTADRHWEEALNLLQALDSLGLVGRERGRVRGVVIRLCAHEKPFVRAWAMSVVIKHIGLDDSEVARIVEQGRREGPASVRARIRRAEAERVAGLGAG